MSSSVSVGDQSRIVLLRQANQLLKARLATLTQEATTGAKADVPAALHGNMNGIAQIEARLALLSAHGNNAMTARTEFASLQTIFSGCGDMALNLAAGLRSAATMASEHTMDMHAHAAGEDLRAAIGLINTDVGGRFVLSGTRVTTAPLSSADQIMADARAVASGAGTPAGMISAVTAWFDAAPGAGGFVDQHWHGADASTAQAISETASVSNDARATDPALRETLKGMVMAALAADPTLALGKAGKAQLLDEGARLLGGASYRITEARAAIGMKEEAVEQASVRNAAERSALLVARSDLLSADPFETASMLTQTESSLQNLYALTARLSRLSLTEYLR